METIYLQIRQKENVSSTKVTLGDIARLSGGSSATRNKLNTMEVYIFSQQEKGKQRHLFHVNDLIALMLKAQQQISVQALGEPDVLVEYTPQKPAPFWLTACKITLICILCFFGSAFTIITFNNDVSATEIFDQVYESFTGEKPQGLTWIEAGYAVGLPLGILIFFNHFSGHRLTTDPTPVEVEMALYESDVNTALMDYEERQHPDDKK